MIEESFKKFEEKKKVNEVYHCGSSINYAGSKTFSINLLEDDIVKENIINYVKNID